MMLAMTGVEEEMLAATDEGSFKLVAAVSFFFTWSSLSCKNKTFRI